MRKQALLIVFFLAPALQAAPGAWEAGLAATVAYDDNLPRAVDAANDFGDLATDLEAQLERVTALQPGRWLRVGGSLQGKAHRDTRGLDHLGIGAQIGLTQKFGLGALAPRVSLQLESNRLQFRNVLRDGWLHRARLGIDRRTSLPWQFGGHVAREWRRGDGRRADVVNPAFGTAVFDQNNVELGAYAQYEFSGGARLRTSCRYRDGQTDSSARPGGVLRNVAQAITRDSAIGQGYVVYRVAVRTLGCAADVDLPLTDDTSMGLGVERLESNARAGVRYERNLLRLQITHRF
ncbi:MAG: hypothetical protein FGM43_03150 [Sinobacteraceae bacterium]|nr:hypothetical protein [Nevskiaceae bacterium]